MNTAETIVSNVVGVSEVLLASLLILLILTIFHLNIFMILYNISYMCYTLIS